MNTKHIASVLIFSALILASCQKEKEFVGFGENIVFSAGTSYIDNTLNTKTDYSGKFYDGEGQEFTYASTGLTERIDWVANTDIIRVYSPDASTAVTGQHWADYKIASVTADKKESDATLSAVGGSDAGLAWGSQDTQSFFAMYPAPGTKWKYNTSVTVSESDASLVASTSGATISGTIPGEQQHSRQNTYDLKPNMNNAYMYAVAPNINNGASVNLEFKPLVTAVSFSLKMDDNNAFRNGQRLNSIKLSSSQTDAYLAGDFSVDVAADGTLGTPVVTNGTNEITIAGIPQTGTSPGYGVNQNLYTFTFLLLPTDQTKLTLTLGFTDGSSRSLDLKASGEWIVAQARKKLFVNNLGLTGDFAYTFTITQTRTLSTYKETSSNLQVRSYKSRDGGATRTPVEWEVLGYYSDEECTQELTGENLWMMNIKAERDYAGSGVGASGETNWDYEKLNFTASYNNDNGFINQAKTSNDAVAASTFGQGSSATNYFNLSNPGNMTSNSIVETANSYIVNSAGYYRIPLVVGNGIVNGAVNPNEKTWKGWKDQKSVETFGNSRYYFEDEIVQKDKFNEPIVVTTPFYDYKQEEIQNVYLHQTSSAAGTPTSAFVVWEDVRGMIEVEDETDYILSGTPITNDGGVYWLNFHVKSELQGNAVIAVTDENGLVMWSWHIWETDYVPANYPGTKPYSDPSLNDDENIMHRPLGYVYMDYGTEERTVYVKVNQPESNTVMIGKVIQPGNSVENIGRNPYYQWGRKDPFWPSDGETGTSWYSKPTYWGKHPHQQTSFVQLEKGRKLGYWIQHPMEQPGRYNILGGAYPELEETVEGFERTKQPGQVYAYNLWNAENYNRAPVAVGSSLLAYAYAKTIYDPCPAGYHMPTYKSFSELNGKTGTAGVNQVSYNDIVFPLSGAMSNIYIEFVNKTARMWLSEPDRRADPDIQSANDNDNYDSAAFFMVHNGDTEARAAPLKFNRSSWTRARDFTVRPVSDK